LSTSAAAGWSGWTAGDHVRDAAAGLVQVGVRGDDGHALARRPQCEPSGLGVV